MDVSTPSPPPRREPLFLPGSDDDLDAPIQPSKPSDPLFLPGSDDDEDAQHPAALTDVNALFDDLEEEEPSVLPPATEEEGDDLSYRPLAPSLDVEALRKEAELRHAKTAKKMPQSALVLDNNDALSKGPGQSGEKSGEPRRRAAKLDEERLLGSKGFPLLIEQTRHFKPKGKGQEEKDLGRLLQRYQFWAHQLNPKMQFRDTVERVEKLCHSKRMAVAMSVWRDHAHGIVKSDVEQDDDVIDVDDEGVMENREAEAEAPEPRPSSPATRPPSSASEMVDDDDDFDVDAMIRQMEQEREQARERSAQASSDGPPPQSEGDIPMDEEAHLRPSEDEDEDMWDIARELEQETVAKAPPASSSDTRPMTDEEEWEDMYA